MGTLLASNRRFSAVGAPVAVLATLLATLLAPAPARADFGIAEVTAAATNRDGTLDLQAGSHPYEYTVGFAMRRSLPPEPEAPLRSVVFNLPAGLVGNPLATPRCSRQDFEGPGPNCPVATQIGIANVAIAGLGATVNPIYNLVPPPGVLASFGFSANESNGFEQAALRTGGDYGLSETDAPVSIDGIQSISETIWGVPGDPGHDAERTCIGPKGERLQGCAGDASVSPFLTLPGSCTAPLETTVVVETLRGSGPAVARRRALSLDAGGNPTALAGCSSLPFDPALAMKLESSVADSPTGMSVDLRLPQFHALDGLAEADLKDAVIKLPDGLAINPPVAAGLAACSPAQIGLEPASGGSPEFTSAVATCPGAAKVGSVEIKTPLVDHALEGGLYLGTPFENPFDSLLALYLVVDDPQSGVVIKLPARLEADPRTGQLTVRFEEAPQLSFEDLELSFSGGPRGVLRTPLACGASSVAAHLTPWSEPEGKDVDLANSFRTSVAAAGAGTCPASAAQAPAAPSLTAGTLVPTAGRYTAFKLKLNRADGTQRLGALEATLPLGLSGRLAGIPYCADIAIAAAVCPPASEVGSVDISAGAGPLPLHLAGHVYLAGPYRAAPLSLAVITPAIAGPFDLGIVAVRIALYVDRRSARIHAVSDPLPMILGGIPLDIRSLALDLDRSGFTRNPTSCEPQSITVAAISSFGQRTSLGSRFQVGDCAALGFRPQVSVRLLGSTHRGAHPELRTVLTARSGDANFRGVAVTLPGTELLDSRHIAMTCPATQFAAEHCPAASVYGRIKAWTPLLDHPLEGPIYLRASKHRLPDLAASLGDQVQVDLVGGVDSVDGRLRDTFQGLPDTPLSKVILTMQGGKRGLLVNTGGLCVRPRRVTASLSAQNGKRHDISTEVKTDCTSER